MSLPDIDQIAGDNRDIYERYYSEANSSHDDAISAQTAAGLLKRSQLTNQQLARVWEIADYNQSGALDKLGFFIALKLVAAQQNGYPIDPSALWSEDMPPPIINSKAITPSLPQFAQNGESEWGISPQDQQKYRAIFDGLSPENDKLNGAQVRPVLLNSQLPGQTLAKIWELSDIDKDGSLDFEEMCVALHLVYRCLEGRQPPGQLEHSIIPPSKRTDATARSRRVSGPEHHGAAPPRPRPPSAGPLATEITSMKIDAHESRRESVQSSHHSMSQSGSLHQMPNQSLPRAPSGSLSQHSLSAETGLWPVDQAKYSSWFANVDTDHDGFVSGADVKTLFMQSGLGQSVLAQIWTLADIKQSGRLNEEQFALAMHFVEQSRAGKALPSTLLPNLVPPSFREAPPPPAVNMTPVPTIKRQSIISALSPIQHSQDIELKTRLGAMPSDELTPSGGDDIQAVLNQIENLNFEKHDVEKSMELDHQEMQAKNLEIKNLQMQYNQIAATVERLHHQKSEAKRRLTDMDVQREALQKTLADMQAKVEAEERETEQALREAEDVSNNMQQTQSLIDDANVKLSDLRAQETQAKNEVQNARSQLHATDRENSQTETDATNRDSTLSHLREHTRLLRDRLAELEGLIESNDTETLVRRQGHLLATVDRFQSALNTATQRTPHSSAAHHNGWATKQNKTAQPTVNGSAFDHAPSSAFASFPTSHDDPFASSGPDPFASGPMINEPDDPFANQDPFAHTDAVGGSDPFGAGASTGAETAEAFAATMNDPFASAPDTRKGPPARPPPAKAASKSTPDDPFGSSADDPFASASHGGNSGGFADFGAFN